MQNFLALAFFIGLIAFHIDVVAQPRVEEGVVQNSEVINTKIGKDGRPLLGAAVGVGIGSAFGSGSGKDAAKIAGGLLGAARQARKGKQVLYGWRYIITIEESMRVVDAWCIKPNVHCNGIKNGKQVYVVDKNYVEIK